MKVPLLRRRAVSYPCPEWEKLKWLPSFIHQHGVERKNPVSASFGSSVLGCALICWRFLSLLGGGLKLALPVMH